MKKLIFKDTGCITESSTVVVHIEKKVNIFRKNIYKVINFMNKDTLSDLVISNFITYYYDDIVKCCKEWNEDIKNNHLVLIFDKKFNIINIKIINDDIYDIYGTVKNISGYYYLDCASLTDFKYMRNIDGLVKCSLLGVICYRYIDMMINKEMSDTGRSNISIDINDVLDSTTIKKFDSEYIMKYIEESRNIKHGFVKYFVSNLKCYKRPVIDSVSTSDGNVLSDSMEEALKELYNHIKDIKVDFSYIKNKELYTLIYDSVNKELYYNIDGHCVNKKLIPISELETTDFSNYIHTAINGMELKEMLLGGKRYGITGKI